MRDIKNEIKEELTIDHDIYISVGLKNPMKPSTFKEIIDTLLFENIGYMSSWGTHTKDEWIEIYNEQAIKMKSLITTIESLQKEIDKQHDTFYNEVRFSGQQLEAQKAITELAVKGLVFYAEHVDWEDNSMGDKARDTLSEIERLQNGTT